MFDEFHEYDTNESSGSIESNGSNESHNSNNASPETTPTQTLPPGWITPMDWYPVHKIGQNFYGLFRNNILWLQGVDSNFISDIRGLHISTHVIKFINVGGSRIIPKNNLSASGRMAESSSSPMHVELYLLDGTKIADSPLLMNAGATGSNFVCYLDCSRVGTTAHMMAHC